MYVEGTPDMQYSEFAHYDLGQAVAHMTVQGLALGLDAHQFRAFDREGVADEFAVPPHWEVASMTAFGAGAHVRGEGSGTDRTRAERAAVTWARA